MYAEVRDLAEARRIFGLTVERVEVETHSYCNRRCSYCPNVIGDRLGPNKQLPSDIWEKLLSGLAGVDYKGYLVLNYYNEPLADLSILDRIREARARLPNARIMFYTNGDYLERGLVDELAEAGLDYMHISIHLKRGERYTDVYAVNRINEISVRMGIPTKIHTIRSLEYMVGRAAHNKLEIEVRGINFEKHGTDRGGLIEEIATASKRASPCFFPFSHFVVSFEGDVVPCCHIRADRPEHKGFVYGNLRNFETIYHAFTSAEAAAWRREVASDLVKRSPCDTCSAGQLNAADAETMAASQRRAVATAQGVS